MDIRMVDLLGQYNGMKEDIDSAIQQVITDTAFVGGKYVKVFADELSDYYNGAQVIPCGNGTDALQLALMAMDYQPGDEVITTPFTFVATVETICLLGLVPVFVDIDPLTFNIDAEQIENYISEKTRCIIPVHLFGQSADMNSIMAIAEKYKLDVIEDTAQAIGANTLLGDRKADCGTIGDVGTLSFFPSKNLGAYGDGGAVISTSEELADKVRLLANHGSRKKYYYETIGINSRLDGIQAAILSVKLKHLETFTTNRQNAASLYDQLLKGVEEITTPVVSPRNNHVFHQYTLKVEGDRNSLQQYMKSKGVPSAIYYPKPLCHQSIYVQYVKEGQVFPVTDQLSNIVLSLPMHSELSEEMQIYIVDTLKEGLCML